jgi:phosphoribosylanthranilate isomerase
MTWIKICGTTNQGDAELAAEAGADALGFVFVESRRRIAPERAKEIVKALRGGPLAVGVFVDTPVDEVMYVAESVGLQAVQLYGTVPQDAGELAEHGLQVLAAIGMNEKNCVEHAGMWEQNIVSAYLLDSGRAGSRGGSGERFDWESAREAVSQIQQKGRVVIAGGLTAENVGEAVRKFRPWGVDVVTGVESAPGKKDAKNIRAFVAAVRQAECEERD